MESQPLSDAELDTIRTRMQARPDMMMDPVVVERLMATLDAKIDEIERLKNDQ
jgi:hypothetical protein